MIPNFKQFLKESLDETRVRVMAWLYMLLVYNQGDNDSVKGLEESWLKDNRMGITFGESVKELKKLGYAEFSSNGKWKITEKGKDELYKFFDLPKTREEWLTYDSDWLKKYNGSGKYDFFTISNIPKELFDIKFKNESKNKINYTISSEDYHKITEWWVKYQRGTTGWWTQLNKYLGLKNELIPDVDEMTLYRGLNFNLNFQNISLLPNNSCKTLRGIIPITDLKVGDKIRCNKPSWSLDKKIAKLFASGKKGWGDYGKMETNQIGIVLKNTFPASEILIDTHFTKNNKYMSGNVVLLQEMEIVVRPRERYVEVITVFGSF